MRGAAAAVASDVWLAGQDAEHEGLILAVVGVGARVVAEADDGVAPGAGAEDVSDVGDRVAEGVALFDFGEGVAESASGPRWSLGEEVRDYRDGFAHRRVELFHWGAAVAGLAGDGVDVVRDEVGEHFCGSLCVDRGDVAGCVHGLADRRVLAVSGWLSLGVLDLVSFERNNTHMYGN